MAAKSFQELSTYAFMLLDISSVIDLPRCLVGHEENVEGSQSTFYVEENMER